MKKIAFFLSIVVAAIACDKVDPVTPPEFDFANPDILVPYQGSEDENLKLEFTTNVDWTAELDQTYDWVSITPKSGKAGEAAITVIATPNNKAEVRSAVITVKAGVSVLVFEVVQEGYPAVTIEPTEVNFEAAGGSQDITVEANVEFVVNMPENDWLTYEINGNVYTLTAAANEAFAGRSLTITLTNDVDGINESIVVSQVGRVQVLWEKALADYASITLGNPIHLAYKDGLLAISTGSAVHVLNSQDGSYMMPVALPEGFVITSLTNDDAGNVVFAGNIPAYATGDIYAISSLETLAPVKVATMQNDVYSFNAGNLRAGGDVTKDGVLTMFVDVSQYWIGCDIVDGVAGETVFGALPNPGAGTVWDCGNGCVTPLGSKLSDGLLATYYCLPALMSNVSGEWANVGPELFSGNDNNCAVAEAVYEGTHYAALAVGSHFNYSATGVYLYDLTTNQMVYSYRYDGDLNGAGVTADAVLVPTDNALLMYYTDLNKGKIVCVEIK